VDTTLIRFHRPDVATTALFSILMLYRLPGSAIFILYDLPDTFLSIPERVIHAAHHPDVLKTKAPRTCVLVLSLPCG